MTNSPRLLCALALASSLCFGVQTKTWTQDDYSEFGKGDLKGLSLSSDGTVTLAPQFRQVLDSSSVYLWCLAEDSKGNLYAGGGGPGGPGAKVYEVPRNGKSKPVAELDALEVHALAIDSKDRIYAATAPDGKVYRITGGKPELFYDPKAKYIWAMLFDSKGDLFIATGDQGEIHKVSPSGKGEVFFKTGETHARSMAMDAAGNLIVGTEPGGLIIRVSLAGQGFVLYQAPKGEITSVAVAKDGSIYAAAAGAKPASPAYSPLAAPAPLAPSPVPGSPTSPGPGAAPSPRIPSLRTTPAPITGGSEVYRITKDGFPRRVWTHAQSIAYTIGFDGQGRPLVGTGNKGVIYRIDSEQVYTDLLNAPPTQVTSIYAGRDGSVYAATGNVGKVFQIGPGIEKQGTLESDVFDAGMFSQWGRLRFRSDLNGGQVSIETRSGNLDRPQQDWSAWSVAATAPDGGRITSPPARFLQWRAVIKAGSESSPALREVEAAYLQRNVAPVIEAVDVTPPNYRFPPQTLTFGAGSSTGLPQTITLPALGKQERALAATTAAVSAESGIPVSMQAAKGYIGVRWAASDENSDALVYTLEIRGEGETGWRLLKDKLKEKYYSWDSTAYPDGQYRVRVIASDSPGNTPERALTAELISDSFVIDNTPPRITGLSGSVSGGRLTVTWRAADALSVIEKAEYSVNGGDWTVVDPTTGISDSRELDYKLVLDHVTPGEQVIAVRVADEYGNQSVEKTVVR